MGLNHWPPLEDKIPGLEKRISELEKIVQELRSVDKMSWRCVDSERIKMYPEKGDEFEIICVICEEGENKCLV